MSAAQSDVRFDAMVTEGWRPFAQVKDSGAEHAQRVAFLRLVEECVRTAREVVVELRPHGCMRGVITALTGDMLHVGAVRVDVDEVESIRAVKS